MRLGLKSHYFYYRVLSAAIIYVVIISTMWINKYENMGKLKKILLFFNFLFISLFITSFLTYSHFNTNIHNLLFTVHLNEHFNDHYNSHDTGHHEHVHKHRHSEHEEEHSHKHLSIISFSEILITQIVYLELLPKETNPIIYFIYNIRPYDSYFLEILKPPIHS